jgi:hypothetical protein
MAEPLYLPMMMFGKYKDYVKERDPETGKYKTVYEKNKNGKLKPKTKWIVHKEENGDAGFFPSVNHIYTNTRGGGRKLTKAAQDLFDKWQAIAKLWCHNNDWVMTEKEKVVVEVWAYFPDNQKRDTNNAFKLMMDALEGIIYDNDYYALPRIMDFEILDKNNPDVRPHFKLNIYRKADEVDMQDVIKEYEHSRQISKDLPRDRAV